MKNKVDRKNGFDYNQLGSSVDLDDQIPASLAIGLAPVALAAAGIGLGFKELLQWRRAQVQKSLDSFDQSQHFIEEVKPTRTPENPFLIKAPQLRPK